MPIYIAMLRGINVSGQKIIKMEHLRASFETLGFRGVETYVQSGNVIFETAKNSSESLSRKIGERILRDFGFPVSIVLKTSKNLEKVIQGNPFARKKTIDPSKLHVTFLSEPPSRSALRRLQVLSAEPDQFRLAGQEIYLYCPDGYGRTKLSNSAFERILSVAATTRNWRTLNKLFEMAST